MHTSKAVLVNKQLKYFYHLVVNCCLPDPAPLPLPTSVPMRPFEAPSPSRRDYTWHSRGSRDPNPTLWLGSLLTRQSLCQLVVKCFTPGFMHVVEYSWNVFILLNCNSIAWLYCSLYIYSMINEHLFLVFLLL